MTVHDHDTEVRQPTQYDLADIPPQRYPENDDDTTEANDEDDEFDEADEDDDADEGEEEEEELERE